MSNIPQAGNIQQSSSIHQKPLFCCNPLQCRCCKHRIPLRIIIAILLHFLLQNTFVNRVVINVAIVEMVGSSADEHHHGINLHNSACPEFATANHTPQEGNFPWSSSTKALVLYAFYIGYTVTQVPGGWFCDKFGARYILATSLIITITCSALFPYLTTKWGYLAAVIIRLILGFAHGPCIPGVASMVSTWIPPEEQRIWGGIAYSGPNLGIIMGNMISGIVIDRFNSWSIAFYIWASYTTCYFFFYIFYVFSFPSTHPFISEDESHYIKTVNSGHDMADGRSLHTPWRKILTNLPMWANIAAHFGHNYIYLCLITFLPTYMREILQFDVANDGFFAAIPFLALWISSVFLSFVTPLFLKLMTLHTFDKYFGAGTNIISAFLALGAAYVGCNRFWSITLYVASMVIKAFYYVTLPVNINTLTKHYGGLLFGFANAVSSLSGIIGNFIIGAATKDKQLYGWKLAYWTMVGVAIFTTFIYFLFSSTERQDFDFQENSLAENN